MIFNYKLNENTVDIVYDLFLLVRFKLHEE